MRSRTSIVLGLAFALVVITLVVLFGGGPPTIPDGPGLPKSSRTPGVPVLTRPGARDAPAAPGSDAPTAPAPSPIGAPPRAHATPAPARDRAAREIVVRGRVEDDFGRPVSGATVKLFRVLPDGALGEPRTRRSDAQGAYAFDLGSPLPDDPEARALKLRHVIGSIRVLASAPGTTRGGGVEAEATGPDFPELPPIVVPVPRTLRGVTRGDDGKPFRAQVTLTGADETKTVLSELDGSFAFDGLPPRRVTLVARAEGAVAATLEDVDLGQRFVTDVVLDLRAAAIVEGVVRHEGRPIESAAVRFGLDAAVVRTDATGRFRATTVRPGLQMLSVVKVEGNARYAARVEVRSLAAATIGIEVEAKRYRASLKGRLRLPGGSPAVRYSVEARDDARTTAAPTDGAGAFELPWPGDVRVTLGARELDRHGLLFPLAVLGADAQGDELDLTVPEPGSLDIAVARSDGRPAAGVEVELVREHGGSCSALTDPQGHAILEGLPPGPWHAVARSGQAGFVSAALTAGGKATAQLVLREAPSIVGRVVSSAGDPGAGVAVRLTSPRWPAPWHALTGTDGRFELRAFEPGVATLSGAHLVGRGTESELRLDVPEKGLTGVLLVVD